MAVLGVDGTVDTSFNPGTGASSNVYASAVQADGKILIGGNFTTYNGVIANRIARLNTDGALDATFTTGTGCNSDVTSIALQPDGKIVISGVFTNFGGVSRSGIARLNANGTLDTTFVPPTVGNAMSILALEDGRVMVRGAFTSVGGASATAYLARLNANGSRDTTFTSGGFVSWNSAPSALFMRDDGQLAMLSNGVAGFTVTKNASAQVIVTQPVNQVTIVGGTATFSVAAMSDLPVTYQWFFNGTPIVGANNSALILNNVQLAQAGSYSVIVRSELATLTSSAAVLTVNKAPVIVTLGNLTQVFDGTPRAVSVTTAPAGLAVVVTYDGSTAVPTNAGSYAVVASVNDANYTGSAAGTLTITKENATITLDGLTAIYDGTPKSANATTSPAGLNVTFTYAGSATPPINAGSYAVGATINDSNYSGTAGGTLSISQASTVITLGNLSQTYDGNVHPITVTTLPAGLPILVTYDGSTTAPTNAGTYGIVAVVNNDANYIGTATGTLTIAKASATISLSGLTATFDGTPKPVTATTSPTGLTVNVTYDGGATAPTDAGSYAVVATVSDANYSTVANDTLTIAKAEQTITFNPVPGVTYGDQPFTVKATSSSGLDVVFSIVSGTATISGNIVTITGAGPVIVRASQSGNNNYSAALNVDQSFTVGKANQAITFAPIEGVTYGDVPFAVTASSNSSMAVTFAIISGPATIADNIVTITGAGAVVVRASQAGDDNHNPAPNVDQTFTAGKANQAITFGPLSDKTYGTAPFEVSATSSTGLPVTFSIANGPATINGNVVTLIGAGTVIVRASQVGDDNHNPAPNVDQTFEVAKATLVVTAQNTTRIYGAANPSLTFTYDGFVNGETASMIDTAPTASTTATPTSNAGSYPITVSGGFDENYTFNYVAGALQISPANQTITFLPIPGKTYGDPAFTPTASADSGLPVTLTVVSGPASVAGNVVTLMGAGDVTLRASQNGNSNYNAASVVDQCFTVTPASATVVLSNLIQVYSGSAKSATVTTNPVGLAVNVTYNGSNQLPTVTGSYNVVARVVDTNYTGFSAGVLVITPATSTLVLSDLVQAYDGTPKSVAVTTTPADEPVTVTYNGNATPPIYPGTYAVVATINDSNYTGSVSGTLTITITALVRHAPMINGGLDGSVQVLQSENMVLNGSAWISGDLLMPGTPSLYLNGHPTFAGTRDASGSSTPTGYTVILNGGVALRYLVRRVDAIAMPVVSAPPAPTGTRSVFVNKPGQTVGSFATLRNLTLNSNVGQVAVPAGNYGILMANDHSGFTLGVADATTPSVYNLQGLLLNGNCKIIVLGPVIINLANSPILNGTIGSTVQPEWLTLNMASGGATFNGTMTFNGIIVAPTGTVMINGGATIKGRITSDRLMVTGNGLLEQPAE